MNRASSPKLLFVFFLQFGVWCYRKWEIPDQWRFFFSSTLMLLVFGIRSLIIYGGVNLFLTMLCYVSLSQFFICGRLTVSYVCLTSGRYLDQTQPNIPDEGKEGWLCGRLPGRKSDRSWWSRSAHPFFSPSISIVLFRELIAVLCFYQRRKDRAREQNNNSCHFYWFL